MPISRSCLYCETRFTASAKQRLFCSTRCRVHYNREEAMRCFYCGEMAADRDHIYPHSARTNGPRLFREQETVNSCKDCNGRMSNCFPYSIEDRIALLIDKLTVKYKLKNITPEWSDRELKELGPSLRKRIGAQIRAKQKAIDRVLHLQAVLFTVVNGYEDVTIEPRTAVAPRLPTPVSDSPRGI